ncbi:MAG TPA: hypothetical protein VK386_03750 [Acidimicrobiales bacterium]|nr:hypothetical protein [Acidimicrobiales bacterium]
MAHGSGPVPLDDYPVHQVALSMRHMATSDRNAYDRYYFNAHDRTGQLFMVSGLGVYPNLGVIDAFATVTTGRRQHTVRFSDALGDDRMSARVGAYRVEVVEPLQTVRLVCEAEEHGMAFDLTFDASFAAVEEPPHVMRQDGRIILDAQRFAQVGTWSGRLAVAGRQLVVSDDRWVGTRDRSWGIRPVGEAEPPGRSAAEPDPAFGFWWTYVPLRFDDFALVVIAQEDGGGNRVLSEAVRVWPAGSSTRTEQLGWPEIAVRYRSGTRLPEGASLQLGRRRQAVTVDLDTLGYVALNCGPGYGGDPDWGHGQWRGRGWTESVVVDLDDPAVAGRSAFGVVDHVARARCDGTEGWGMFEHATFGRHAPSGFADWGSVAP